LHFHEGLARVTLNGKWGFIDKTGKEIVPPMYDHTWGFHEGLAAVELNNKWGFIDKTGKLIVPPMYDFSFGFQEGLARVTLNYKEYKEFYIKVFPDGKVVEYYEE
jgi:hypothetical protein